MGGPRTVLFHGHLVDPRTAEMLTEVEAITSDTLHVWQGSYSNGAKSGGTHTGGGAVGRRLPDQGVVGCAGGGHAPGRLRRLAPNPGAGLRPARSRHRRRMRRPQPRGSPAGRLVPAGGTGRGSTASGRDARGRTTDHGTTSE